MATRKQVQHYLRMARQAETAALALAGVSEPCPASLVWPAKDRVILCDQAAGHTGPHTGEGESWEGFPMSPVAVPELLEVPGGWAELDGFAVVKVTPWADPWGDGR